MQLGTARNVVIPEEERRRTAYHEAGHALLGMLQPGADPVRKVSIIPRGRALGVTLSTPESDRYGYDANYLRGRIIGALGGMAAEQEVFDIVTTGAESDLEMVTRIARSMVGRWGMSERIGTLSVLPAEGDPRMAGISDGLLDAVDEEVRRITDECYAEARRLLRENRDKLDAIVDAAARAREPRRARDLRRGRHRTPARHQGSRAGGQGSRAAGAREGGLGGSPAEPPCGSRAQVAVAILRHVTRVSVHAPVLGAVLDHEPIVLTRGDVGPRRGRVPAAFLGERVLVITRVAERPRHVRAARVGCPDPKTAGVCRRIEPSAHPLEAHLVPSSSARPQRARADHVDIAAHGDQALRARRFFSQMRVRRGADTIVQGGESTALF